MTRRHSVALSTTSSIDPLSLAIAPPQNESIYAREEREHLELMAKKISDDIDDQIRKEKERIKKRRRPVKVLLLGQSESGKSATLKNFQLTYARREWSEERASWRSVIQLNLVRNVNEIMDVLSKEFSSSAATSDEEADEETETIENHSQIIVEEVGSQRSKGKGKSKSPALNGINNFKLNEKYRLLKLRLGPLRQVQADLEKKLGSASMEMTVSSTDSAAPFERFMATKSSQEFSINSSNGWKYALDKLRPSRRPDIGPGALRKGKGVEDEVTDVLLQLRDDIKSIWEDPAVKKILSHRKARIEDSPGFFLGEIDRIAVPNYQPSDDDVIRARLRTIGVSEYKFVFESGRAVGQEWLMYDVGGLRGPRGILISMMVIHTPYSLLVQQLMFLFTVDAIIFLAPISSFDEKLAEDRRVNRLEDSYLLWRSVCSCKLLARTHIVLFLNKCDLLQAKLMRGVRIRDYVPSYSDRRNDLPTATKYFQQHFKEIAKNASSQPRPFYVHLTSVIDVRSTAVTLGAVEESILRDHLRKADLM